MNNDPAGISQETASPAAADAARAVMRFVRVLRYRKLYVIAAVAIMSLLGCVYFLTAPRVYQASASLLVTQTGPDVWNASMSSEGGADALIPTYERLFSSAVVLDGAIQQLKRLSPAVRVDFAGLPPHKWAAVLRENVSARAVRRTNLIEIGYRSKDPLAAEAVVDALVHSYLDFMDKNHQDVSVEIVSILDRERKEVETKLAEKQHELLKVKHRVRDLGIREGANVVHPAVQRVLQLNETLMETQQERLKLEALLVAIHAAIRNGADLRQHLISVEPTVGRELVLNALGVTPEFVQNLNNIDRKLIDDRAKLDVLLGHYGPAHPKVVELGRAIRNAEQYLTDSRAKVEQRQTDAPDRHLGPLLIAMVEQKLAEAGAQEGEMARQYQQSEAEAVGLNDRMAELQIVENELQRLRALHETLLNRIANIDINRNHTDVRVAVVSEPTALERPVSPRLSLIALVCLFGGAGAGVLAVYVLDLLDDRFRSPEEMKEQLGAPLLAMIRRLPPSGDAGALGLQVHVSPEAVESESFRTLRTTLAFSGQELERLAVTSSEPGDGKTTVLANLGVAYAQAGKRTLLIDADLRKPGLSKLLNVRGQNGLSQVLRSDEEMAEACRRRILPTGIERLDVLPCGPRPSDPGELISGARMADLLEWASGAYDQVLIDCPPVLAASDAAIAGRLAGGVVLVVQPEKNHRRVVLRAAENLTAMHVNLIGFVANFVADNESGYYGYGSGYGYGYGYGYGHGYGEEQPDQPNDQEPGDRQPDEAPEYPADRGDRIPLRRRAA